MILLPWQPFIPVQRRAMEIEVRDKSILWPTGDLLAILEDQPDGRRMVEGTSLVARRQRTMMRMLIRGQHLLGQTFYSQDAVQASLQAYQMGAHRSSWFTEEEGLRHQCQLAQGAGGRGCTGVWGCRGRNEVRAGLPDDLTQVIVSRNTQGAPREVTPCDSAPLLEDTHLQQVT